MRAVLTLSVVLAGTCLAACGSHARRSHTVARSVTVARAASPPGPVSVFPIPHGRVASPQTQIAFRGVSAGALGSLVVTGSRSGRHAGRVEADSDGDGASFLPARPFLPGELVTVSTHLNVRDATGGTFRFRIATPAGAMPNTPLPAAGRVPGDVLTFRSRPDLSPASVEITQQSARTAAGDIFLAPEQGPVQNGPMILAPNGDLVWFKAISSGQRATDFRVQSYRGQPVLTWWQGHVGAGVGVGEDVIYDRSYRQMAVVYAANGLSADLHEFQLTPAGAALITAYYDVLWKPSSNSRAARVNVLDSVVQEIDVKTGLVLFQWDSLDHVPPSASYQPPAAGQPLDYFHVNSVQLDSDGDLVLSGRNTWAAYKVDADTGGVVWTLGGKRSDFKMGPRTSFAFQHDVRVRASDSTLTLFDDGAGPPTVQKQSRALTLRLDPAARSATLATQYPHTPAVLSGYEGNVQLLDNNNRFLGWGQQPYFSEFDARGQQLFDGRFVGENSSYRVYRFPWSGDPQTVPAVAVARGQGITTVDVSWNGATAVTSWRVLAGASASSLQPVSTVTKQGFETEITVPPAAFVAVQALDARGRVLATSQPVSAH